MSMMSKFLEIFVNELKATFEGLTGQSPSVGSTNEYEAAIQDAIHAPAVVAKVNVKGDSVSHIFLVASPILMSAISQLMLGEEDINPNLQLNDDEIDASKEVFSNLLGAISTSLGAQKELKKVSFEIANVNFIGSDESLGLSNYETLYLYNVGLGEFNEKFGVAVDLAFSKIFNDEDDKKPAKKDETKKLELGEDMKNIGLIMDVRLPIRVRIGSKKMLLKDVLSMDIGSVIELNQLANDPLEVLIGDKPVALGEVVIVDGNFGVQITEIGNKKERLEQLR